MWHSVKVDIQEDKRDRVPSQVDKVIADRAGLACRVYLDLTTGVIGSDIGLEEQDKDLNEPERGGDEGLLWEQAE